MAKERFERYPYDKLSAQWIRLFELDLNREDAELSGILITVPLPEHAVTRKAEQSRPEDVLFSEEKRDEGFDALSYTWGTNEPAHSLRLRRYSDTAVSGNESRRFCIPTGNIEAEGTINISPNLRAFLTQRRKDRGDGRWLWVDQICIQQTTAGSGGNVEFQAQAPLMAEIYSRARCVLVWLGEADARETEALEHLPLLSRSVLDWKKRSSRARAGTQAPEPASDCIKLDTRYSVWHGASSILFKPWFERLWVLQEFTLARSCTIVLGSGRRPFADLIRFLSACEAAGAVGWIMAIARRRRGLDIVERHPFLRSFQSRDHFQVCGERIPLPMLLLLAQDRKASHAKDMVLGLMGLMTPRCRQRVAELDEACSVRDVYLEFGKMSIEENEHPETCVLNHTTHSANPSLEVSDLPSWCPDLRVSVVHRSFADAGLNLGMTKQLVEQDVGFSAGFDLADPKWTPERKPPTESEFPSTPSQPRNEIYKSSGPRQLRILDGGLLQASGVEIDLVQEIHVYAGREPTGRENEAIERMWRWEQACQKIARNAFGADAGDIADAYWSVYARTLVANTFPDVIAKFKQAGEKETMIDVRDEFDILPPFKAVMEVLKRCHGSESTPRLGDAVWYIGVMKMYAEGHCFFRTRGGRIGLGPWDMQEGDRLCVFFFCPTPYIVRPAGPDRWTFIGEAYVHGLMFGQALKMLERGELIETSWIIT